MKSWSLAGRRALRLDTVRLMQAAPRAQMAGLSLNGSYPTYVHAPATNAAAWKSVLAALPGMPPHRLSKTLVLKPKLPKSAPPKLVMLVALDDTATSMGAVAQAIGVKEVRLAAADQVRDALHCDAETASPLCISEENASQLEVALDAKMTNLPIEERIAFHKNDSTESVLLTHKDILSLCESLNLKTTVVDFAAEPSLKKEKPQKAETKPVAKGKAADAKIADAALVGITVHKELDFSRWYQEVLVKSEMIDYYDVSGCYILRPWSYSIWEEIQKWFNDKIKAMGVENASFPLFISARQLEREKDHLEGFSPEVAWITKAGQSKLDEPIAVRPTSETAMYPYYAKWIRSHRDLPLKYNQWNSVVRWEFKNPQPFLRTREFLWQEGHTAHLTEADAEREVFDILDLYARVYTDLLAVPVVKGRKTEKEKFAGGLMTTTVEGYIPTTGRGIQGGTSHALGQNFSKMFDISVENPNDPSGEKLNIWQNSWGLSTRVIGVMVMIHGDSKGLKLPPAVAQTQVVTIPCGITSKTTQEEREQIEQGCQKFAQQLRLAGIRAQADLKEGYTPGWKFSQWEMKGVPLRIEFGPKDKQNNQVTCVRRDNGERSTVAVASLENDIRKLLDTIQRDLYKAANAHMQQNIIKCFDWNDFVPNLNDKKLIMVPWCNTTPCEDAIKEKSARMANQGEVEDEKAPSMGAKNLCNPLDQPGGPDAIQPGVTKCVGCGADATIWGLFGRSY